MKSISVKGSFGYVETEDLTSVKNSDYADKTGVYIWAIPVEDGYMVTYVGITGRNFAKRTQEHLQCYLSGDYGTYKLQALKQGRTERIFPGICRDADIEEFIENHQEIFTKLKEYLYNTEIFLIPLNRGKQFRENLESAIADEIRNSSNTGDLPLSGSPKQDYEPDEESETIEIDTDVNFIGLPTNLEV